MDDKNTSCGIKVYQGTPQLKRFQNKWQQEKSLEGY